MIGATSDIGRAIARKLAGAWGRAENYVCGSAKAGFTAFLSGLRNAEDLQ